MNRGVLVCTIVGSIFLASCNTSSQRGAIRLDSFKSDTLHTTYSFGHFRDAKGISADAFGNIYICDAGLPGILKFSGKGDSIRSLSGFGNGNEQFDSPRDIDASLGNFVAIADYGNHRIQVYSKDLIWQFTFDGVKRDNSGEKIFAYPQDVAMNTAGVPYLIDGEGKRVIKLQTTSNTFTTLGTSGNTISVLWNPISIVVSADDETAVLNADGMLLLINPLGKVVAYKNFEDTVPIHREVEKRYDSPMGGVVTRKEVQAMKLAKIGDDLLFIRATGSDIIRADFSSLEPEASFHIAGLDGDIRDVTSIGRTLYILTAKSVYTCTIGY